MNVSVYEDFKNACAEAIRSIQARSKEEVKINEGTNATSNYNINNNTNNSVTDVINSTTPVKDQKNEESKRIRERKKRNKRKDS